MQVTKEQIDPCKIALTISVEPERVEAAKEKAFGQFARNLQLPGFRKGKVPPHMARTYVDEGRVKQRAAEMLVEPAYAEALETEQVEPFGAPELDSLDMQEDGSLVFKALVPLKPVVTLGPHKGLNVERRRLEVVDADVDRQIEELQRRSAEYEEVTDRIAQMGDIAVADLVAQIEGQETPELAEPRATFIEIGKNIPDFDNGLVGMAIGETKTIEALYPDDFTDEAMRGKRATFTVTLNGLRTRSLPELNDAFAEKQTAYPEANTLEALRTEIRTGLERAAQEMAENDLEGRLIQEIVSNSQISFPDVLLREQMAEDARDLTERLERENATLDQYLEAVGKTREQVEAEMAAGADRRIRNGLVLAEIAQAEGLTAEEADIEAEINERAERAHVSAAAVRAYVERQNQMESLQNRVLTKKVFQFLKDSAVVTDKVVTLEEMRASGEGDDQDVTPDAEVAAEPLAVEQTAAPKRRGKKAASPEA